MCPILNKVMTWLKLFYLWILQKIFKTNGTKAYKEGQDVKQCEACCQPLAYYCTACQIGLCKDCSLRHALEEPERLINILLGKNVMHILARYRNKNDMNHELPLCRSHTNTYCIWFCFDCNILFCKLCSHNIIFHRIVSIDIFVGYSSDLLKQEYDLLQNDILPVLKQYRLNINKRTRELKCLMKNAHNWYSGELAQLFENKCLNLKDVLFEGSKSIDWKIALAHKLVRENRRLVKCPLYLQTVSKPLQFNVCERFGFDTFCVPGGYSIGIDVRSSVGYILTSRHKYQFKKPISPSKFLTDNGIYTTKYSIIMLFSYYRIYTFAFLILLFTGFIIVLWTYCFPVLQKLTNDLFFLANNPAYLIENEQKQALVTVWITIILIVIALAGNRGRGPYFDF